MLKTAEAIMKDKVVITCAVTGVLANRKQCAWVPYTPEEIGDECQRAYEAGAAVCHIHARDPDTGGPAFGGEIYGRIATEVRKRCPVLILCADNGPEAAAELLEAGADDYVCLPFNGRELAARARALIRRSSDQWLIPGSRTEVRIDPDKRMVQVGPKSVKLTPTEFAIFQYLAERPGIWISSDRIISEVIGTHHAPRTALVRVHVHHIRRKLGDCGWCVRAEHGRGYMLSV